MNEKCKFCEYVFKDESERQNHSCKNYDRIKILGTVNGIASYNLFKMWRSKKKYSISGMDEFVNSRYFTVFIHLHEFMVKKSIYDSSHYIDFCISKDLLPNNWYSEDVYIEYLIFYDRTVSPIDQYKKSQEFIKRLCSIIGCSNHEVFKYLHFDEVLKMICSKNLSPWYLLLDKGFDIFYFKTITKDQKILMDAVIDRDLWRRKLTNSPSVIVEIKKLLNTSKSE